MSTRTETRSRKITPSTAAIELLPTELARWYTHVHPVLLLATFYVRFHALVEDPVSALTVSLVPVSILQLIYVVVCLPPWASSSPASAAATPAKPSRLGLRRRPTAPRGPSSDLRSKVVPALLSLTLTLILGTPILTVLLVLFGAPLTTHFFHNALCAAHLAVLTALPLVYVHGVDKQAWREIASAYLPFDDVWGASVGTAVGAWLGAVPIPLDWDREWQKWPVTIVTGAYVGCVVGKILGGTVGRGKRIEFDERDEDRGETAAA